MSKIKIGCQTYTWEMLGEQWKGSVDDILDIIAQAGYEGVEITNTMIGHYYDDPDAFANALAKRGLAFPSFGFIPLHRFTESDHIDEELRAAEKGIDFVSRFPGCRLDLAGGSTEKRDDLDKKFETMCSIYNRIGEMAAGKKVAVDVHPHSHAGSIIETAEEYEHLMELTNSDLVNWCPDTGHIVRGGLDLLSTLRKYRERIRNFHFKDAYENGKWAIMGDGICDFKGALALLEEIDYSGWVIGEEESDAAYRDQVASVTKNRQHLRDLGY